MRKNKFSASLLGALLIGGACSCVVNAQGPAILPEPIAAPPAVLVPAPVAPAHRPSATNVTNSSAQRAQRPRTRSVVATGRITHVQNANMYQWLLRTQIFQSPGLRV